MAVTIKEINYIETGEVGWQDIIDNFAALKAAVEALQTGAVMESDIKDQSFTNLLENGDFESWSAGTSAAPDGWELDAIATVARSATHKIGAYSAAITPAVPANKLQISVADHARYQGRTVTVGCWVYAANSGKAKIAAYDGVVLADSADHTGGSTWQWLTASLVVDAGATELRLLLYPDHTAGTTIAYFDGAIMVEGSVCPAFSPKPITTEPLSRISTTTVAFNATGQTTLYTVPAGKTFMPAMAIIRAGADAGATDVTFGRVGALTDWLGTIQLDNLDAAGDQVKVEQTNTNPPTKSKTYAAAQVFQIDVTAAHGGVTNYVDLFGYLV